MAKRRLASIKDGVAKIFALGARAVLLKKHSKQPAEKDWLNKEPTQEEVETHVAGGGNVGVLLGAKSNGLSDVDLDSSEARALARAFLLVTGLVHGRASSLASHWWYRVTGLARKVVYLDPAPGKEERAMLLELRRDGHQTAVPPTVHPTGEQMEWERGGEPATVSLDELLTALAWLAIAALLVRTWTPGGRNDIALAVAGWLLRKGHVPEDVEHLIYQVALAAGDEEADHRSKVVRPTAEKLERGEQVVGWRKLADVIGEPRAKALWNWLPAESTEDTGAKLPPPMGVQDLFDQPEREIQFLVVGLIPTAANLLIVGYPKSFKTFAVLELAVSLGTGTPFFHHFPVTGRHRVGLVLMEDHPDRVKRRLWRIARSRGREADDLEGFLFFWFRPPLVLKEGEVMRQLAGYVTEHELDVLLIDNWSYVSDGDSNDADNVTRQLRVLADLRNARPELVTGLVQHARKKGPGQGHRTTDVTRNSSAFGAWHDVCLVIELKDGSLKVQVELRDLPEPDPFYVEVEDEKPGDPDKRVLPSGSLSLRVRGPGEKDVRTKLLEGTIIDFLRDNPGCSKNKVQEGVSGKKARVAAALQVLEKEGRLRLEKSGRAHKYYALDEDEGDDDTPSF